MLSQVFNRISKASKMQVNLWGKSARVMIKIIFFSPAFSMLVFFFFFYNNFTHVLLRILKGNINFESYKKTGEYEKILRISLEIENPKK